MNLALVPLLLVALLMASADSGVDTVQLLVSGTHDLTNQPGAVVVADATARVDDDTTAVPGPMYVIGGDLVVAGHVAGDIVQLAGAVRVADSATIDGELRHVGGSLAVAPGAVIGRRTSLPTTIDPGPVRSGLVVSSVTAVLLALVAARLQRRRGAALDNVAGAILGHPIVTVTVGTLAALTAVTMLVFMAFTLLLLPVALAGVVIGVVATAYGVIALGHLAATRLAVRDPRWATPLGVVAVVAVLHVLTLVPVVGDLLSLVAVLTGLGAVLVTYFGATHLHVDALPE